MSRRWYIQQGTTTASIVSQHDVSIDILSVALECFTGPMTLRSGSEQILFGHNSLVRILY